MTKERIEEIGKFLNYRMIIHRNVENNSHWTTEEKMIVDLYDNYLDLKIENNKQKEVIDKAIEYIEDHSRLEPPEYECLEFYSKSSLNRLLDILKGSDSNV